jgi:N-acetylglutamate synthase-like GNAT family acetyltransferase
MTSCLIRLGKTEEIDILCEIALLAWKPIYEYRRQQMGDVLFEHLFSNWRENKTQEIRSLCEKNIDQLLVLEEDNQIKGFATFLVDPEKSLGIIGNNAVHPDAQGKGFGKMLHHAVLDKFRKRGFQYAQVLTGLDPAHDAARGSYLKAGFALSYSYSIYHMKL